jgi:hypothetical protein
MALALVFGFGVLVPSVLRGDEVVDWNVVLQRALFVSNTPGPAAARVAAIVHVAIFDAINGIERRYDPIHLTGSAPRGASRRAAAVQAAYATLVKLYPSQKSTFDQQRGASLAAIRSDAAVGNSYSVVRGIAWGQIVANAILVWRSTDGFDPSPSNYQGSNALGKWRPTPPAFAPGLFPSLAHTLPFAIPSPSSYRPAGPPALTSAQYAADLNEVKVIGELTSTLRTADQTEAARFWQGTAPTFWNRAAATAARQQHTTLSDNARLFALLNVAMADAAISCWDAKYFYEFWRPITAIRLASTDGNPDTVEQADWTPLIVTPPFPDYTANHASVSGAAHAVLTIYFGDDMAVEGTSEGLPGVVRSWPNFTAAADEANLARIWGGIHFRTAVRDGRIG